MSSIIFIIHCILNVKTAILFFNASFCNHNPILLNIQCMMNDVSYIFLPVTYDNFCKYL